MVDYFPIVAVLPCYLGSAQDETLTRESTDAYDEPYSPINSRKLAVFGNMYGMTNMILFLLLVNFIASLMAVQLLRGYMLSNEMINFGHIFNAFLGMWQIFTSENWSTLLYAAAIASQPVRQSIVVILFLTGWMLFANCTSSDSIVWTTSPHCSYACSHHDADVHCCHQRKLRCCRGSEKREAGVSLLGKPATRENPGFLGEEAESIPLVCPCSEGNRCGQPSLQPCLTDAESFGSRLQRSEAGAQYQGTFMRTRTRTFPDRL